MVKAILLVLAALIVGCTAVFLMTGSGGFKRAITLTGIYAVCKPHNYPVVCFLDADSKEGGMFCIPLSQAGGQCQ